MRLEVNGCNSGNKSVYDEGLYMFLTYVRIFLYLCLFSLLAGITIAVNNGNYSFWFIILFVVNVLLLLESSRYEAVSDEKSAWQMKTSEVVPDAELINVEVKAKDGSKKIIWRVSPDSVDFSDSASEPVISFMIVKLAPVTSESSN